jgi:hypothetical protein
MVTSEQSRNEQVLGDWGVQECRLETRARHRYGRRWPPSLRSGGVQRLVEGEFCAQH